MFQEAKNAMERTLYMTVSPKAYENIKQVTKVGAVGGALYAGMNLGHQFLQKAYGAFKDGVYYCDPSNIAAEINDFVGKVNIYNLAVDRYMAAHPKAALEQLYSHVYGEEYDTLQAMKHCVESNLPAGVSLDSVVHITPKLAELLAAYVSEFEGAAGGLAALAFGIILGPKIARYVKEGIHHLRNKN